MKMYVQLFLALLMVNYSNQHLLDLDSQLPHKPTRVEVKEGIGPGGFWQAKLQWKAHWVRHWETRTYWVPVLRKVWGPVEMKEWIPFPKPNPTTWTNWTLPSH